MKIKDDQAITVSDYPILAIACLFLHTHRNAHTAASSHRGRRVQSRYLRGTCRSKHDICLVRLPSHTAIAKYSLI